MDAVEQAVNEWQMVYAGNGGNLHSSMRRSINVYLDCVPVEKVAKKLFLSKYPDRYWDNLHQTQKNQWIKFANVTIQTCKV